VLIKRNQKFWIKVRGVSPKLWTEGLAKLQQEYVCSSVDSFGRMMR